MSATTERLFEQIKELQRSIEECKAAGGDSSLMEENLRSLLKDFNEASEALIEGKQILKG